MGENISLTASDGFKLAAWRATPVGRPVGGMVVLQEIFGVNAHMKRVTERFAAQGYLAICPALFDRAAPGADLGYGQEDMAKGRALRMATTLDQNLADIAGAIGAAAKGGKVGVVGFCWGGALAFMAAARLSGIAAGVGYYGGGIAAALNERPNVPVMLHFGAKDAHIPMSDVAKIRAAFPEMPVFDYPAGHGFNRDGSAAYDEASAKLARERSLAFFKTHMG